MHRCFVTALSFPYSTRNLSRTDCTLELSDVGQSLATECKFTSRVYPPDTVITHQGDDDNRAFFIASGWARLYRDLASGERQTIDFPLTGDVIGHCGGLRGGSEGFSSITALKVWVGQATALRAFSTNGSRSAHHISDAITRQRALLTERLADIGQRNAAVRTAHFLLELGARLELSRMAARESFPCPLTQTDLAGVLGLTSIHVNRMLREARELGLYEFHHGHVRFIDYDAAASFADFNRDYLVPK